jgi:membrane carboxypeptidase/penicillin-binding protein PbpC
MTDYETRRITFGSVAKFFELPGWRVAAKSGTTDGPRDFWTVGGSPYYTVTLWAGHTDNNVMNKNASSGQVIAAVWRKTMEILHKDKEKKNFETTGLRKINIDSNSGLEGEGNSEELTPKQIEALNKKSKVIGSLFQTAEALLQIKKKNIFDFRTTVIPIKYLANKVDGKFFNPELNNPSEQEERSCYYLVAEFNEKIYNEGLDNLYPSDKYCKKELLVMSDQNSKNPYTAPVIATNLEDNSNLEEININISTTNETVKSIEIFVDDIKVGSENSANFNYIPVPDNKKHKIVIKANLSTDKIFEQSYQNVTFKIPASISASSSQITSSQNSISSSDSSN